jgi:hypothetical protein
MDNEAIDKKISDFLHRRPGGERSLGLSAEECYRYLAGELKGEELDHFLKELRGDRNAQELLAASSGEIETNKAAPVSWVKKAKRLWRAPKAACPHCGKTITALKKPLGLQAKWLLVYATGFCVSFALSFVVPRYFMQCLLLAAIFAFKAIVDLKAVRTQILVYKALADTPGSGHSRDLHNHSAHL